MSEDLDKLKKHLDLINLSLKRDNAETAKEKKEQDQVTLKLIEMLEKSKKDRLKYNFPFYVIFIIFLSALLYKIYYQLFP